MIDLKMTAEEAKHEYGPTSAEAEDAPKYPYGTALYLNEDTMKKLGLETLPAVGTEMTLTAKVKIVGVSERERLGGEKCQNVDMQITEMELGAPQQTRTQLDRANMLYGGEGDAD